MRDLWMVLLCLSVFFLPKPLTADDSQGPEAAVEPTYTPVASPRGARPHVPFEVGQIDTVDTSSGNLTVRIPLGQAYEVGPNLSYRFQLIHNSSVWDFANSEVFADPSSATRYVLALANPGSNVGLGWEMHFGKLYAPENSSHFPSGLGIVDHDRWPNRDADSSDALHRWMYVAPDGARHYLYNLPGREAGTISRPVRYSKSGSLRLRKTDASTVWVEFPNGTVSEFSKTGNTAAGTEFCGGAVSGCWRLEETRDLYGNRISFDYEISGDTEMWTVSDSTGRSHELEFSVSDVDTGGGDGVGASSTAEGDEPGDVRRVLKSARLATFGGTADGETTATYSFDTSVRRINRGCPNPWGEFPSLSTLSVPILSKVHLPESVEVPPWVITTDVELLADIACRFGSGRVESVRMPTLGTVEWQYGTWRMPTRCTYSTSPEAEPEYSIDGVHLRTTKDRDGNVEGHWEYQPSLTPVITADAEISGPGCIRAKYRITQVDAPTGENGKHTRTLHYGSVYQGPKVPNPNTAYDTWQVTDHGLPYSKHASITGSDGKKLFLSQAIYECTGDSCEKKRSIYRRYTSEYRPCTKPIGNGAGCFQVQPQQTVERTVFHDDAGPAARWIETSSTDNTGAGHFRSTTVRDNFADADTTSLARSVTTDYTATGETSLSIDGATGYLNIGSPSSYLPLPSEPWLLTPFNKTTTIGDGRTYVQETQFNEQGSAVCSRTWRDADERGPRDVVVELTLGSEAGRNLGLPVTEIVSGGEYGQAGMSTICDGDASTDDGRRYVYEHDYSDLVLRSTRFAGFSHYLYRADIDANTGLETSVYDVSDLRTGLTFDKLGRLRFISPENALRGMHVEYVYSNPDAGDAKVEIFHRSPAPSPIELAKESTTFDGFGRVIAESRRKPVGSSSFSPSIRRTTYDALSRKTSVTQARRPRPAASKLRRPKHPGPTLRRRRPADGGQGRFSPDLEALRLRLQQRRRRRLPQRQAAPRLASQRPVVAGKP